MPGVVADPPYISISWSNNSLAGGGGGDWPFHKTPPLQLETWIEREGRKMKEYNKYHSVDTIGWKFKQSEVEKKKEKNPSNSCIVFHPFPELQSVTAGNRQSRAIVSKPFKNEMRCENQTKDPWWSGNKNVLCQRVTKPRPVHTRRTLYFGSHQNNWQALKVKGMKIRVSFSPFFLKWILPL